jgi:hypothetical protein
MDGPLNFLKPSGPTLCILSFSGETIRDVHNAATGKSAVNTLLW